MVLGIPGTEVPRALGVDARCGVKRGRQDLLRVQFIERSQSKCRVFVASEWIIAKEIEAGDASIADANRHRQGAMQQDKTRQMDCERSKKTTSRVRVARLVAFDIGQYFTSPSPRLWTLLR